MSTTVIMVASVCSVIVIAAFGTSQLVAKLKADRELLLATEAAVAKIATDRQQSA